MTEEKCHSLTPLSLPGIPCGRRCPRPHVRVWLGQILGCEAGKVLRHRCSHTHVCVCVHAQARMCQRPLLLCRQSLRQQTSI